jgi:hypothetical protein
MELVIVRVTFLTNVEFVEEIALLVLVALMKPHVTMPETLSMMGLVFTVEQDVRILVMLNQWLTL